MPGSGATHASREIISREFFLRSLWDEEEAARYQGDLAQRVYTSRLLGRNPALVLHGGGNTSVKIRERNVVGQGEDILYVKGSGWDLATIEEAGFSPARLDRLLKLAELDSLSDDRMAKELKSNMTDAAAPAPSVEAILHAILPHRFVDHTHADAFIAVSNTPDGLERVREVYGDSVVIIPYVMPGFALARICAQLFPTEVGPNTIGMTLMNHGLFSFGETAHQSYQRMIDLVTMSEEYLRAHGAWEAPEPVMVTEQPFDRRQGTKLRRAVSDAAGAPMIVATRTDAQTVAFAQRPDVGHVSQQGPATPDHVLRTKRLPMIGFDLEAYRRRYAEYFAERAPRSQVPLTMLDPAPRVILSPEIGMATAGRTVQDASITADIYRHTMEIIQRAEALGGYQALPSDDIFKVEYWDLEQAKLRRQGSPPMLAGEIALVTGAASGIGKACVDALLVQGAAVAALDINPAVVEIFQRDDVLPLSCDIGDESAVNRAMDEVVRHFGGLDMLILNAGIFPPSHRIEALPLADWEQTMRINLDANVTLLREGYPLLKCAPRKGRVVIIGSKNVPAPGPGAAAYSASKAGLTQLARVAALEWGRDGIRVNVIHPNAVFDTGLWTDEVLQTRAASYGMSVEEYRRNNVLGVQVTSRDVAELAIQMCGPLFAKTTGAQVPVDGGNERVI